MVQQLVMDVAVEDDIKKTGIYTKKFKDGSRKTYVDGLPLVDTNGFPIILGDEWNGDGLDEKKSEAKLDAPTPS